MKGYEINQIKVNYDPIITLTDELRRIINQINEDNFENIENKLLIVNQFIGYLESNQHENISYITKSKLLLVVIEEFLDDKNKRYKLGTINECFNDLIKDQKIVEISEDQYLELINKEALNYLNEMKSHYKKQHTLFGNNTRVLEELVVKCKEIIDNIEDPPLIKYGYLLLALKKSLRLLLEDNLEEVLKNPRNQIMQPIIETLNNNTNKNHLARLIMILIINISDSLLIHISKHRIKEMYEGAYRKKFNLSLENTDVTVATKEMVNLICKPFEDVSDITIEIKQDKNAYAPHFAINPVAFKIKIEIISEDEMLKIHTNNKK